MRIDFNFDISSIRETFDDMIPQVDSVVSKTLDDAGEVYLERIDEVAPRKTGAYADSWQVTGKGRTYIEMGTPMKLLFTILEFTGRRPSRIYAKDKLLKFKWMGRTWFLPYVNHPGFDAIPHARPALTEVIRLMPAIFYRRLREVVPFFD